MSAHANIFGSPSGGAEHYNQAYASTKVRKKLDTTNRIPCPLVKSLDKC